MPVAAGNKRLNLDELIQQRLLNDPFRQQAGDWFSKVLAPGYQAYTPEQMNQMYQARAQQMVEDVFKPQEERFAARLATSGLSGSGVAADLWANEVMKNQNRQLGDLWSQIEQENLALTRADQAQALSMFPALSSLGDVLTYRGILSEDEYQNRMYELQKKGQEFEHGYKQDVLGLQREGQAFDQAMRQLMYELEKEGQQFEQGYKQDVLGLQREGQTFDQMMRQLMYELQKEGQQFEQGYKQDVLGLQREGQTFDQMMRQLMYELQKEGQLFDQDYRRDVLGLQREGQTFDQAYRTQLLELQRLAQEFERQMASEQFKYQKKKDTATGLGKLLGGIAGLIFGGPGGAAAGAGIGGLLDKIFS